MLAEDPLSWSDRWEREGRQSSLEEARGELLQDLERRFGPLPEEVQRRVGSTQSIQELVQLTLRAGAASSLSDLLAP
jgi:hypothetical protein